MPVSGHAESTFANITFENEQRDCTYEFQRNHNNDQTNQLCTTDDLGCRKIKATL